MEYRGAGGLTPYFGGSPAHGLRRELDRFFEDVAGQRTGSSWVPAVDVRENQREIALDVELPGIKAEDVEVNVDNGLLTITGEKRAERKEEDEGRYHLVERSYGSFLRSFTLPQGVDEQQISADFDDGVLHVRIPKEALPQPRRIEVGRGQARAVAGAGAKETERNIDVTRDTKRSPGETRANAGERDTAASPRRGASSEPPRAS